MQLFIGRQPIVNVKRQIIGYELLFRKGEENYYSFNDGNEATMSVIGTTLYHIGFKKLVGNKKAFFNFTRDVLKSKFEEILPKNQVVIEVLEDIEIDDELVSILEDMKQRGYSIALDDVCDVNRFQGIEKLIDYVKVDWMLCSEENRKAIPEALKTYPIHLLAEKIEEEGDFNKATEYGYTYFQGYFFSKPVVLSQKALPARSIKSFELMSKVNDSSFSLNQAAEIIKQEPALALSLLTFVNSAAMSFQDRIKSVDQALILLGESNVKRWIVALIVTQACNSNPAIINMAVERAKFCELLAIEMGLSDHAESLFLVGLFSLGERMLDQPMDQLIDSIGVDDLIGDTLLGKETQYSKILNLVKAQEKNDFQKIKKLLKNTQVSSHRFQDIFTQVIDWSNQLTM